MTVRAVAVLACAALALPLIAGALERPETKDPAQNYLLFCGGCHSPQGAGAAHRVPALNETLPQFLKVAGGRDYLLHVPGVANSQLSDAAMAAVMNWCTQRFAPEQVAQGWQPFTTAEIAAARRAPRLSVKSMRRSLMELTSLPPPPAGADY